MSDTDDDTSSIRSGYVTPPLSPTKTISTEGCFSPRTPGGSPRKTRNCLYPRAVDDDADHTFFTPPASPTKSKSTLFHGALSIPEVLHATSGTPSPQSNDDSPVKRQSPACARRLFAPQFPTFAPLHTPSIPDDDNLPPEDLSLPHTEVVNLSQDEPSRKKRRSSRRSVSDSLLELPDPNYFSTPFEDDAVSLVGDDSIPTFPATLDSASEALSSTQLRQLPPRYVSSPLRPSQWLARGGSLQSPRKGQSSTPDRFIACRRPPAVTRESYELNKPAERLEANQTGLSGRPTIDAFSRRLRRSGRLNDELRGLREAHSMIVRRASAHRRNPALSYRRNSFTADTRQISAGAVWNVGGPSAVSDTVIGVSNGRGGMLGSGTNAPLYTSSFLNRADPEAELEAYERRLALALDVDQTNRILQHSPVPPVQKANHGGALLHVKHTWRDGAWVKDGVISRLFLSAQVNTTSC
jgi:hypothetical protein